MKGMEMMFDALRKMIPASVWEMVEKNVTGINASVTKIEIHLAAVTEQQKTIIAQNTEILTRLGDPSFSSEHGLLRLEVPNGAASQTD